MMMDGLRLCNYGTIFNVAQFPNEAGALTTVLSLYPVPPATALIVMLSGDRKRP